MLQDVGTYLPCNVVKVITKQGGGAASMRYPPPHPLCPSSHQEQIQTIRWKNHSNNANPVGERDF